MRASSKRLTTAASIGILAAFAGCKTPPPDPDGVRGGSSLLEIGKTRFDALDCDAGDCADWYRVPLETSGRLVLRTATPPETPAGAYTLLLENGFGEAIDSLTVGPGTQSLSHRLEAGIYMVGFRAPAGAAAFSYTIGAEFEPSSSRAVPVAAPEVPQVRTPAPEPPPAPTFREVEAEVLEVEGRVAEPEAVLLDLGETRGAFEGQRGELRERDTFVGEIEIVDVYPEGSRARVISGLRRPLTPGVRAVLLFPDGGQDSAEAPDVRRAVPESDAFPPDTD